MHRLVIEVVGEYLRAVDRAAPGLIEGLYLEGSVALDDFHPDASDIDFVAVTADRLDAGVHAALTRVHAGLRRRPSFDGVYLTWTDLARGPAAAGPLPHVHAGRFLAATPGEHNPITWHTLAQHGVRCRGPLLADVEVWTDAFTLAAWTLGNLDSYWRPWLARASRMLSRYGLYSLTPAATVWVVTGIPRLHYTLTTGRITSKTGATHHALTTFPTRWHPLLHETLRLRSGNPPRHRNPLRRRHATLSFGSMVIDDAQAKGPPESPDAAMDPR